MTARECFATGDVMCMLTKIFTNFTMQAFSLVKILSALFMRMHQWYAVFTFMSLNVYTWDFTDICRVHFYSLLCMYIYIYIHCKNKRVSLTHLRLPEFQFMTSHDYGMYTKVII